MANDCTTAKIVQLQNRNGIMPISTKAITFEGLDFSLSPLPWMRLSCGG
jgi:hypothetical protein